jgi:hypothetical protein
MRKLVMLVFVVGLALSVMSAVATAGGPLPPIQPGSHQGTDIVLRGVLGNFVAPTATSNGSVDVAVTLRVAGQHVKVNPNKVVRVVLTRQTLIAGNGVFNGRQGLLLVKRQWSLSGPTRLVAIALTTVDQPTGDQPPVQGTPINPDPPTDGGTPTDDGTPVCSDIECAAP